MKKSPGAYVELLNAVVEHGSITTAARSIGVSPSSVFSWAQQSAKGEPGFEIEWMGEVLPLHLHLKQASRQVSYDILDGFRKRMRDGTNTVAQYQGKTIFKRDPALDTFSDEELEALGFDSRYLRDEAGNFIPEVVWTPPPMAGVLAVLQAEFPRLYGNKSTVEISQRTSGVVRHQVSYALPKPPAPVVEVLPSSAPLAPTAISDENDDLSDILGDIPEEAEFVEAEATLDLEPVPEVTPAPEAVQPDSTPEVTASALPEPEAAQQLASSLSGTERELLAKLRAGAAKG